MIVRLALASIAVGLLLFAGGVFLSEGYSAKRGFLESLPKMKVRLTADERRPQFSQVLRSGTSSGQVVDFEGKLIQIPYEMAESELSSLVEAFDTQRFEPPRPNHMYFFKGWVIQRGTTIPLGPLLAVASALVIVGATVLVGVRTKVHQTSQAPMPITEETASSISEPVTATEALIPTKPSRLRLALHLWGGVCMKAAADVSELFVIRGSSDVESARTAAAAAGLMAALFILAGYYLSYQLISALDKTSIAPKARKTIMVLLPFAYFVAAILVGGTAGLLAGKG